MRQFFVFNEFLIFLPVRKPSYGEVNILESVLGCLSHNLIDWIELLELLNVGLALVVKSEDLTLLLKLACRFINVFSLMALRFSRNEL